VRVPDLQVCMPDRAVGALHLVDRLDVVETAENEVEQGSRVAHRQVRRYRMDTVGNVFDGHALSLHRAAADETSKRLAVVVKAP